MDKRVIITFIATMLISIVLLGIKACKKECNPPLIVMQDTVVNVGTKVIFSCITESEEPITWNFGDNETSQGFEANHVYNNPGIYTVSALQSKECIGVNKLIRVVSPPQPAEPQRIAVNIVLPDDISAEQSVSIATDAPFTEYEWRVEETNQTSSENSLNVSFSKPGSYKINLKGNSSRFFGDTTVMVKVGAKKVMVQVPASLSIVGPKSGIVGSQLSFVCNTPYLTQYAWNVKETGQTYSGSACKIIFDKGGVYTVSLSASGNAGGKSFSFSKNTTVLISKAKEPAKPSISNADFAELIVKIANKLADDEKASDSWKDKVVPLCCSATVALKENGKILETITLEKFKQKQILSNSYEVFDVLGTQRGAEGCISSVTLSVKKN
ncbi:MAG: PKD domain-containing protein [Bacteroidota bacterium]|jgi:PKD repeat protein